ncbi:MAG: dihydrodipicolinate synthase family protein, partial [bacterium]|nr:dihydrodipicolinate synthase family protein [bacterium]
NEDGSFNETGQRSFLDFLVERDGISAYFVRCGMGQMYTFSYDDVKAMAQTACGHLKDKAPVLVGTSGVWDRDRNKLPDKAQYVREACELGQYAQSVGAAGVVFTIPECIAPEGDETPLDVVLKYFETISGAVSCPVFIYQPPGTDEDYCVTVDVIRKLADMPNLTAIKMSTTDAYYVHDMVYAVRDKDFAIISGAETAFLAGVASGTKACIGQGCTVNPQIINAIQDRFEAGDLEGAREAQWTTNVLVDRSVNAVEFTKRYAAENGHTVPIFGRGTGGNPYVKDRQLLTDDAYAEFKALLEAELPRYL